MYYTLEITGAAAEASIVSTADLKTFLRVDHSDEDTLIEALRSAAIEYVQNYCNVQLGDVTAVMYFCAVPGGRGNTICSVGGLARNL